MTVLEILTTRFSQLQLKGFKEGYFDASGTKFMAFTVLSVKEQEYTDLINFYPGKGHSIALKGIDDYQLRNDNGDGTYSMKPIEQVIKEEIVNYISTLFYGVFYKDEWYILHEYSYYQEAIEEEVIKTIQKRLLLRGDVWTAEIFMNIPEFKEQIDYKKAALMASEKCGKPISQFGDYKEVQRFLDTMEPNEVPKHQVKTCINFREFVGQPWITANNKQEAKDKINRQFEAYINEAVFIPLVQTLKSQRPIEFCTAEPLYSAEYFTLIYPHPKEHVIGVVKAINQSGNSRLYYFLYVFLQKKIYEWTLPLPVSADGHYSFYILDDIKNLSYWGDEFDLFDPSVTMDDPHFWSEYVFKTEHGQYKYLRPVDVKNNQPDIYSI